MNRIIDGSPAQRQEKRHRGTSRFAEFVARNCRCRASPLASKATMSYRSTRAQRSTAGSSRADWSNRSNAPFFRRPPREVHVTSNQVRVIGHGGWDLSYQGSAYGIAAISLAPTRPAAGFISRGRCAPISDRAFRSLMPRWKQCAIPQAPRSLPSAWAPSLRCTSIGPSEIDCAWIHWGRVNEGE